MTLREILQIELWSQAKSRKILVWLGVVAGGLVVAGIAIYAVEFHWLTPGERRVALAGFDQIEALRKVNPEDEQGFEVADRVEQGKVNAAFNAAWTGKDHGVASILGWYLWQVEVIRRDYEDEKLMEQRGVIDPGWKSQEQEHDRSQVDIMNYARSVLQKQLGL